MYHKIIDRAEQIATDLDIDIGKLTPRGMDELYERAEQETVDALANPASHHTMKGEGDESKNNRRRKLV